MAETGGYNPSEAQQPANPEQAAVLKAIGESGQSLDQIARDAGLTPDGAQAALGWMEQVRRDNPGLAAATGAAREVHTNDEYQLPSINELMNGGGNYWRPLFSAERAGEIGQEDDLQSMAEKGFPHMLTRRESLSQLLEQVPKGEQTNYKALSSRILEMSVRRTMIEDALAHDNIQLAQRLAAGMTMDDLLKQGEQMGLLKPAKAGGLIASDADDIRTGLQGRDPVYGVASAMLSMETRLGIMLKNPSSPVRQDTFLPHISPVYAGAFGRYCNAKLASTSATPPAVK